MASTPMSSAVHVAVVSNIAGLEALVADGLRGEAWAADVTFVDAACTEHSPEVLLADPGLVAAAVEGGSADDALVWFQSTWAGVNTVLAACRRRGLVLTRAGGIFGRAMGEYVLTHMLWRERRMGAATGGAWTATEAFRGCRSLTDVSVGIVGYGSIGAAVAALLRGAGVQRVLGVTRSERACGDDGTGSAELTQDARRVFAECDYVVNLLPQTAATTGYFTPELLGAAAGRSSPPVFINVGRGTAIDEATVVAALDGGLLAHAVLDVHAVEPLPAASPLWQHPAVTVTPHIAALTTPRDIAELFVANLERYVACRAEGAACVRDKLQYVVDMDAGY
eukprot:Rhum_TRINITY_DN3132_c0_g1::Rhum_TRINITY_DN3132_c0_g1_i1::g.9739::m.9739